jgi:hypothetical protein
VKNLTTASELAEALLLVFFDTFFGFSAENGKGAGISSTPPPDLHIG